MCYKTKNKNEYDFTMLALFFSVHIMIFAFNNYK